LGGHALTPPVPPPNSWQAPAFLSDDGDWLYFNHGGKSARFLRSRAKWRDVLPFSLWFDAR
jgi:hypothetical protein